jgi:CubicO group peptidase (beta-lactamase class C family)
MRPTRLAVIVLVACALAGSCASAAPLPLYPGKTWAHAKSPESLGYSSARLAAAHRYADSLKTAAVVIVVHGVVLDEWGKVDERYLTHSCRKSFLSALYGRYVKSGQIGLDRTMADLGMDDDPPLSAQEKTATVRDCLKARSGVFHTAEAETDGMHKLKPPRDMFKPGEFWLYNNWDFNVLGTIFTKLTGKDVFQALEEDIARPIGMDSLTVADSVWVRSGRSIHPAYMFVITAHDMARFGLLMLRNGQWNGKEVIPAQWVKESTTYFSDATIYRSDGYGYMWWVAKDHNKLPHLPNCRLPEGTYSARGAGGHFLVVIPDRDMVVVHRVDTFVDGNNVTAGDFGRLLQKILDAKL